jgi:hypothetical protein
LHDLGPQGGSITGSFGSWRGELIRLVRSAALRCVMARRVSSLGAGWSSDLVVGGMMCIIKADVVAHFPGRPTWAWLGCGPALRVSDPTMTAATKLGPAELSRLSRVAKSAQLISAPAFARFGGLLGLLRRGNNMRLKQTAVQPATRRLAWGEARQKRRRKREKRGETGQGGWRGRIDPGDVVEVGERGLG